MTTQVKKGGVKVLVVSGYASVLGAPCFFPSPTVLVIGSPLFKPGGFESDTDDDEDLLVMVGKEELGLALSRHFAGDSGDVDDELAETNDRVLKRNVGWIDSRYRTDDGICFWVCTDLDEAVTTIGLGVPQ